MLRSFFFLAFFMLFFCFSNAQVRLDQGPINVTLIHASGSYAIPIGDLSDRFGNNFGVHGGVYRKYNTNWIFGLGGGIILGNDVELNGVLDPILTEEGTLIGNNGNPADWFALERGFHFSAVAGKLFPVIGPNENSGLIIMAGPYFLEHKIKYDLVTGSSNILQGETVKIYDQLTNGFGVNEFLGYLHQSNNGRINFMVGLDFAQAFTQNRRDFNADVNGPNEENRTDMLFGLKAGWIIPVYGNTGKDIEF